MMLFSPDLIGLGERYLTECAQLLTVLCAIKNHFRQILKLRGLDTAATICTCIYLKYKLHTYFKIVHVNKFQSLCFLYWTKNIKIIIMLRFNSMFANNGATNS